MSFFLVLLCLVIIIIIMIVYVLIYAFLCAHLRSNVENQILKAGFTSREIIIMENDDPGGVFEFSPLSRGPWVINVSHCFKAAPKRNRVYFH